MVSEKNHRRNDSGLCPVSHGTNRRDRGVFANPLFPWYFTLMFVVP